MFQPSETLKLKFEDGVIDALSDRTHLQAIQKQTEKNDCGDDINVVFITQLMTGRNIRQCSLFSDLFPRDSGE